MFPLVAPPPPGVDRVRYWDLAASADPSHDRSAGLLMAREGDRFTILDLVAVRQEPGDLETTVRRVADLDGPGVPVVIEQEPGAAGKQVIHWWRRLLSPVPVYADRPSGSKVARARIPAGLGTAGRLAIAAPGGRAPEWRGDLLDEARLFPTGGHDDLVDALSGAAAWLAEHGQRAGSTSRPTRRVIGER
jgi:predicted phage terminase large subunit-like protein